ncbi:MAG: EAL domain-containing protein [Lachnospiraceae bacterium]|nr:EAL domain-containing protein [Lachnospiraceae bacterium]
MNIKVQLCALILLLITLFFYKKQRPTGLKTAATFYHLMILGMLSIVLDTGSSVAIYYIDYLPVIFVDTCNKLHLLSLVAVSYMLLTYTTLDIHSEKNRKLLINIYTLFSLITGIAIAFLPISSTRWESSYQLGGASVIASYVSSIIFIGTITIHLFLYKKRLNDVKFFSILVSVFVLAAGALVQVFIPDLLLLSYAIALCITILFIRQENPITNIDKSCGAFTSHVLHDYLKQCYTQNDSFAILVLNFEQDRTNAETEETTEKALTPIVSFLHVFADIKVYCHEEKELYLVFKDEETMLNNLPQIKQRFKSGFNVGDILNPVIVDLKPTYISFADASLAKNADEVIKMFNYVSAKINAKTNYEEFHIDANMFAEKNRFELMEATIQKAIEDDRVEVFFQPIFNTHKEVFTSAEALVRLRQEDGSILPPGAFIPVAESTGLISKIGEIVFDKTCQFLANNNLERYGFEYVEVNLSIYQCEEVDLADRYIAIMDKYNLEPSKINLEITETGSLSMRETLLSNMHKLIDKGVTFSLDDFGSGQSNLNYIVDMPVHIVKFDRDMTQAYFNEENNKGKSVVRAATMMIHELKLKVVSEGVETEDQLNKMVEQGIDYIQGYYFSKPLPQEQFYEFIKEHAKAS